MKKFTVRVFCLITLVVALGVGGTERIFAGSGDEGSASGGFLKIDPSAASSGFGSAYSARPGSAGSVFFNPASLGIQERTDSLLTNMDFTAGIGYRYAGLASPSPWTDGGVGISLTSMDYGRQKRTRIAAENPVLGLGGFESGEGALSFSYGERLTERLLAGVTTKWVRSSLAGQNDSTESLDLGLLYRTPWEGMTVGMSGRNLTGELGFDRATDPLPRVVDIGAHYVEDVESSPLDWRLGWNYVHSSDADPYVGIGTELVLYDALFGRIGYKGAQEAGKGLTFGFGFQRDAWSFNYSFVEFGNLGRQQKLSLTFQFDGLQPIRTDENKDGSPDPDNPSPAPDPLAVSIQQRPERPARGDTVQFVARSTHELVERRWSTPGDKDHLTNKVVFLRPLLSDTRIIRLSATDRHGRVEVDTHLVRLNRPPRIAPNVPNPVLRGDADTGEIVLSRYAEDPDGGPLNWSLRENPDDQVKARLSSRGVMTLSSIRNHQGFDTFVLILSDGSATDTKTINVTIQAVNKSHSSADMKELVMVEDGPDHHRNLDQYGTDPEGDELRWSVQGSGTLLQSEVLTKSDTTQLRLIPLPNQSGTTWL